MNARPSTGGLGHGMGGDGGRAEAGVPEGIRRSGSEPASGLCGVQDQSKDRLRAVESVAGERRVGAAARVATAAAQPGSAADGAGATDRGVEAGVALGAAEAAPCAARGEAGAGAVKEHDRSGAEAQRVRERRSGRARAGRTNASSTSSRTICGRRTSRGTSGWATESGATPCWSWTTTHATWWRCGRAATSSGGRCRRSWRKHSAK